jgi:hypothetical protein
MQNCVWVFVWVFVWVLGAGRGDQPVSFGGTLPELYSHMLIDIQCALHLEENSRLNLMKKYHQNTNK